MCRERKTPGQNGGCRTEGRVETEGLAGARSIGTREAANGDGVELLGKVLSVDNMFDACERVVRNGGSAGVDGIGSRLRGI
jgi:hypothetical protein